LDREIRETRVRYGYRRAHVLLERKGWSTNIKRTCNIYRDLGLQLSNKTTMPRLKADLQEDRRTAVSPNDVWAMDFVHDQLASGKKLPILTVVDTFSRYVPVRDLRDSYRGEDVMQRSNGYAARLTIRRRFVSIRGLNLCPAILIYEPTLRALSRTSHGRENLPTMLLSKHSMAASERSA